MSCPFAGTLRIALRKRNPQLILTATLLPRLPSPDVGAKKTAEQCRRAIVQEYC
jgi:hypothetical protein